jgi:hypothetical protein
MASLPSPPRSLPLRCHHRTQSLPLSATPCTLPRTRPRSSLSSPSRDGTPPSSPLSRQAALPTLGAIVPNLPVRSPTGSDRIVLLTAEATHPISVHRQIHLLLPSRHRIWVSRGETRCPAVTTSLPAIQPSIGQHQSMHTTPPQHLIGVSLQSGNARSDLPAARYVPSALSRYWIWPPHALDPPFLSQSSSIVGRCSLKVVVAPRMQEFSRCLTRGSLMVTCAPPWTVS